MNAKTIDFAMTIIGLNASMLFFLFMLGLTIKARRQVPTDRWLAVTLFGLVIVCINADIRFATGQVRIPYASSVSWLIVLTGIAVSSRYMLREYRELARLRRAERNRLGQEVRE